MSVPLSMTLDEFWEIIEVTRRRASDPWKHHEALLEQLEAFNAQEVFSFAAHFYARMQEALRNDLWAATEIVEGGCSDDSFIHVRAWLIAQGREFFEAAMYDPQIVGERASEGIAYEQFEAVVLEACRQKGDFSPQLVKTVPATSNGKVRNPGWDLICREEDIPRLFHKLWTQFRASK